MIEHPRLGQIDAHAADGRAQPGRVLRILEPDQHRTRRRKAAQGVAVAWREAGELDRARAEVERGGIEREENNHGKDETPATHVRNYASGPSCVQFPGTAQIRRHCYDVGLMLKINDPSETRVTRVTFNETLQAEIGFADGREVVWTGQLAAELRAAVQLAVRRGFERRARGSSGPNSIAN
jgi:hypothetical protein